MVRQSGNARNIAFLAFLLIAIFIPVYWFYDLGVPALGVSGRMQAAAEEQVVTDVERGYALFLANCARCHSSTTNPGDGKGGVGPPLNDQAKLFNAINQNGGSGTGHLNPNYIHKVLEVGGRYVCGDANSVMPAWLQPNGPLNYREVEELVAWITASSDITFTYDPHSGHAVAVDPKATPYAGERLARSQLRAGPRRAHAAGLLAQPQRPDRWWRWRRERIARAHHQPRYGDRAAGDRGGPDREPLDHRSERLDPQLDPGQGRRDGRVQGHQLGRRSSTRSTSGPGRCCPRHPAISRVAPASRSSRDPT